MLTDEGYGALLATVHRVDLLSRRVADVQLQTNIGVGRSMFLILELLSRLDRSGTSQRVIADSVGLTKAAVSRQLAIAQQEGLVAVRRATESRRENKVMLTTAGRRLVQRGRRHRARAVQEATAALGADEMARATRTLVQLADLLEHRLQARP
jgi:DNA-binding MarR family transcriptional regulator